MSDAQTKKYFHKCLRIFLVPVAKVKKKKTPISGCILAVKIAENTEKENWRLKIAEFLLKISKLFILLWKLQKTQKKEENTDFRWHSCSADCWKAGKYNGPERYVTWHYWGFRFDRPVFVQFGLWSTMRLYPRYFLDHIHLPLTLTWITFYHKCFLHLFLRWFTLYPTPFTLLKSGKTTVVARRRLNRVTFSLSSKW